MNAALPVATLRPRLDLRLLCALAYVYVVWGSTYLAMRVAVAALPPWGMAGTRFATAGLLALAIARIRGELMPSKRDWLLALPTGVCLFVAGNGLVAVAEQSIPSSVAAVVAATAPFFLTGFNAVRGERAARADLVGMGLGVASGEHLPAVIPASAILAWIYMVVLGSLVGFTAFAWLLRHARPAVAMSYAYVNPLVAVILGAMLGGEHIGASSLLAAALIAGGVMVAVASKSVRARVASR